MRLLFKNIKELLQVRESAPDWLAGAAMQELPTIRDAFLLVREGKIADFGAMKDCPDDYLQTADEVVDASGKMLLPAWCDSHTHLVFAGNREGEFIDRIRGLTYEEIARKGGGILNSARLLQETPEEALYEQSRLRLEEVIRQGTGAVEIKSGYGLTPEAELKMLRVIRRLRQSYPLPIKATYLAAHALPPEYKGNKAEFLRQMTDEVLPTVAREGLAEYIDAFCEEGYFSVSETEQVMEAGKRYGLRAKIHVNQFNAIGGVAAGVAHEALSVDHLEVLPESDVEALKGSATMPVALPNCSFFLSIPYTPARRLLEAGLPLALASDYNPGSAPSGNMNFVVAAACIKVKLTPEEAINAATINGAYAMGLSAEVGSITAGKRANLILTRPIASYGVLPYAFGNDLIDTVYISGNPSNQTP